jgi:hypothetical protein
MAERTDDNRAAAQQSAADDPPYKCETTDEPGICLRFNRNPRTGQYNLPPTGIRMRCVDCQFWMDTEPS